jgi:hypothetical protein
MLVICLSQNQMSHDAEYNSWKLKKKQKNKQTKQTNRTNEKIWKGVT